LSGDESPNHGEETEVFEFDCPECGTHIVGAVSKCPNCGVEFIIEEVEEFKCPECGGLLPTDATECPECGAEFEILIPGEEKGTEEATEEEGTPDQEEEGTQVTEEHPEEPNEPEGIPSPREEFPRLVAEVKPMMALAREFGVDTSQAKMMIDKAVAAGKQGELNLALERVRESKVSI
jgi:hypothetical protein